MALLSTTERAFCESIQRLTTCNPFLPERVEYEREALGDAHRPGAAMWSKDPADDSSDPNLAALVLRADTLLGRLRTALAAGAAATPAEMDLYEDLVLHTLYHRYAPRLLDAILPAPDRVPVAGAQFPFYADFLRDLEQHLRVPGCDCLTPSYAPQVFALFFQLRRAFQFIYEQILGESMPSARLRAAAWQSIFTHDLRRYRRGLHAAMGELACLITGPSGTGKELVARAIGLSRHIPFNAATLTFSEDFRGGFFALNLSAMSPTLIESELFGHLRGAFTGALQDRKGWLESCPPRGTVFLDEIGDVDAAIQVKLLRVIESRTYQRIGDTASRRFQGKIVAATNRDLAAEMRAGRFRRDLYYRLCSDIITTPSLREQLDSAPGSLVSLVGFLSARLVGRAEAPALADEVLAWIDGNLPPDYPWPGNVRELDQCVRNILVRQSYVPPGGADSGPADSLAAEIAAGSITADELLRRYCRIVHAQTGNYQETARRLRLDHRTVKRRLGGDR